MKKEITKEQSTAAAQDVKENLSDNEGKVGGMLHDARVKKGYKIADIAKELYIRASYLEAIETAVMRISRSHRMVLVLFALMPNFWG